MTQEMQDLKTGILMVGGALSLVMGLIGILNFINSMITGMLSRRREFTLMPIVISLILFVVMAVILPGVFYRMTNKRSVVEQLHEEV